MAQPPDATPLLVGLLRHMREVLGDRAAAALAQYAALEETRRWNEAAPDTAMTDAVARLAALLGSKTELVESRPDRAVVRVEGGPVLNGCGLVEQSLVLGLVKGAFLASSRAASVDARADVVQDGLTIEVWRRAG